MIIRNALEIVTKKTKKSPTPQVSVGESETNEH